MTDVMMDLETLSIRPHAAILVIGAIKFNRGEHWDTKINKKGLNKLDTFYIRIDLDSCKKVGLHVDNDTEKWWKLQDKEVQYEALHNPDRTSLSQGLIYFKEWFGYNSKTQIWGNGSGFDCSILGEAYRRCNMEIPWKFWNERDLRTIMNLADVKAYDLPQYQKHHALYDCYRQIIGFQKSEEKLGI